MNIYRIFLVSFLLMFSTACQDRENKQAEVETAMEQENDSWNEEKAMTNWKKAWNTQDVQSIKSATADDAVLFFNGKAHREDSLSLWIQNSAALIKNLRTTSLMKNRAENLAYEAGTYTHATTENDTVQIAGTYTLIWERAKDQNDWAIKLIIISPQNQRDSTGIINPQRRN